MAKPAPAPTLSLTIHVEQPVAGVGYALQRGRDELEQVQIAGKSTLHFTFDVSWRDLPDGGVDFRGEHVQGPRGARFVYITSGVRAGQHDSCWDRRAKISLMPLCALLATSKSRAFDASFAGTGRDGGPSCATVPFARAWLPSEG